MTHVMIDTETLGLTPGSVVRTVSLVEFVPETGVTGRQKTWIINLQDSIKSRFRIEAGSLKWWLSRSETARRAFIASPEEEVSLNTFVSEFIEWFRPYAGDVTLWGLQVDFDTSMLRPYLAHYHLYIFRHDAYDVPWNRRRLMEVHPFMDAYLASHPEAPETGHTSTGDCLRQIEAVKHALATMQQSQSFIHHS